jgi:hypothetical protein
MYRLALVLLVLAIAPAAAAAAPFGELPAQSVQNPARWMRATGAPGEVVRWAPQGAEFLQPTGAAVVIEEVDLLPDFDPIMLTRPDSVNVQVLTGASGGRAATSRTVTAKLSVPRLPRFEALSAIRRGKKMVVTWHTASPLRRASVVGVASPTRALADRFFGRVLEGKGRRHFRLSVDPGFGRRYVQLFRFYEPDATERRIAVVPVTKRG